MLRRESILDAVTQLLGFLVTDSYPVQDPKKYKHEMVQYVGYRSRNGPAEYPNYFTADPVSGHRGIISMTRLRPGGSACFRPGSADIINSGKHADESKSCETNLAIIPLEGGGYQRIELAEKSVSQVLSDP